MNFKTIQISSLQRVFLDGKCNLSPIKSASVLRGERFSYQIAYKSDEKFFVEIRIRSKLSDYITLRTVGNVPSELPIFESDCDCYERTESGLFPDVLMPIENNTFLIKGHNYYSVWITAELPENISCGEYDITAEILRDGEVISSNTLTLNVINAILPKQELIYTQWFHCDGISRIYNAPVFSEKFWEITESFIKTAVHTGINMLLTPVFTPPLDTRVGGERLTVQLVDVSFDGKKYSFGFDNFIRWIKLAQKCGIKYFEISHLFSQWGAKFAPKIIATVNGEKKRIFGWDTFADSKEYNIFLSAFIPELIKVIRSLGIDNRTYFHISDEPNEEQASSYAKAKNLVAPLLEDFPIIDALSDYCYYKNGLISHPIPCTTEIENFIKKGFPHPWTYYCCGQGGKLSNRFFGMPLSTTRAIGLQFFKFDIEGFLQWGYNFYNSQFSLRGINPFEVTDADSSFPSGDSFSVYPGKNGALESVRSVIFYEALQDLRALKLLSRHIGKNETVKLLENEFGQITFTEYPRGFENILKMREIINNHLDRLYKI